jgi:MFS-type transporter involved in bile tolerance (Atg22 family)
MSGDQRSAIAAIGAFFVVGLLLLARVPADGRRDHAAVP